MQPLIIDPTKLSLGIPRFYFTEKNFISIPSDSIYEAKPLSELIEYDKDDDSSYFGCDFFQTLTGGRYNPLFYAHLDIPNYIFYETEEVICFTSYIPDNLVASDDASVTIYIKYKRSNNTYNGCFATYKHMIKFWQMQEEQKEACTNRRYYFFNPYAYPTKYLDRAVIQSLFEYFAQHEYDAAHAFSFVGQIP